MATQGGIIGIRGTVGGLTFAKDGTVRQKQASRQITSPRTLENNAEFGAAGSAGKLLRDAFRSVSQSVRGKFLAGRMTQAMRYIIGLDTTADRGQRQVLKANLAQLVGFNFSDASLSSTMFAPFVVGYNKGTLPDVKTLTVLIPALVPNTDLSAPAGATHYQIQASAVQVNFATGEVILPVTQPAVISGAINGIDAAPGDLDFPFLAAPAAGVSTVVALGVAFYQQVNGSLYPMNNGTSNSLSIVFAA